MRLLKLFCAVLVMLCACSTGYQSVGFTGGYEDTRLDENIFSISFRGNAYTSTQRAQDFALLRAAELTLQHGYKYFAIISSDRYISTTTYTTPTETKTKAQVRYYGGTAYGESKSITTGGDTYTFNKPRVSLMIISFPEKPETDATIFNARFLRDSIRKKYGLND